MRDGCNIRHSDPALPAVPLFGGLTMGTKRRVLLASGIDNTRALTLEVGSVVDDKYIMVGIQEGTETVICLHLTKRELLRNVIDLCEED